MDKITWLIDNLASTKLTQNVDGEDVTLDFVVKDLCQYCSKEKTTNTTCCGYSSWKRRYEINIQRETNKHKSELILDLEKALFNENLSDFEFILENEKIPVSKVILSSRSPVFDKFFNSDFKEKTENAFEFELKTTIPNEIFKELIRFIYTGEVYDLPRHVFDLLHAADYYQVDGLKTICEDKLLQLLNEGNANKIFQAAHLYQCRFELKEAAYALIKKIFEAKSYKLSEEFLYNPIKIATLFEKLDSFEKELSG